LVESSILSSPTRVKLSNRNIMLHIIHRHYLHIFIGSMIVFAAISLGLGILAYTTFISYHTQITKQPGHPHQSQQLTQLPKSFHKTAHSPAPSMSPAIPDVHIPPVIDGVAPVVTSLPTKQPVVFLTIDDGAHKSPDELQMMQDNHLQASLFLARLFINDNPGFFKDFATSGNPIEDHTLSHNTNMVRDMSYEQQKAEICGMADYEQEHYGRRPIFFRPPGGAYSLTMRRAAADCGMRAVVTWIAKANGGSMQYQIGDHLRPGDIVLMHFRPEFKQDLQAFIDAMKSQGLHTELLENWI